LPVQKKARRQVITSFIHGCMVYRNHVPQLYC
jgi:hypothetical protein